MLIDCIREEGTTGIKEAINSDHIARAWEESRTSLKTGEYHTYTKIMFSCGLVVEYKWFIVPVAEMAKPVDSGYEPWRREL